MKKISLLVLMLSACASGPGLVPGQSVAEVEARHPAEKRVVAGETVYYFPELPWGYRSYAARVGADGKLIAVEQRLTEENIGRVIKGKTTGDEVRGDREDGNATKPVQRGHESEMPWRHLYMLERGVVRGID